MNNSKKKWLSTLEAAKILGVSRHIICSWIRSDIDYKKNKASRSYMCPPYEKVGRLYKLSLEGVEEFKKYMDFITLEEAAKLMNIDRSIFCSLLKKEREKNKEQGIHTSKFPPYWTHGNRIRFKREDVEKFIENSNHLIHRSKFKDKTD